MANYFTWGRGDNWIFIFIELFYLYFRLASLDYFDNISWFNADNRNEIGRFYFSKNFSSFVCDSISIICGDISIFKRSKTNRSTMGKNFIGYSSYFFKCHYMHSFRHYSNTWPFVEYCFYDGITSVYGDKNCPCTSSFNNSGLFLFQNRKWF